jgi:glycosyltransferase involved in cell wall biosynthesis
VSLVTVDLPAGSSIWNDREVVELTNKGVGDTVLVAAVRFLLNQFRMCIKIWQRPENIVLFFGSTSYVIPIFFSRAIGKTVLVEPRGDVPLTLKLNWERQMSDSVAELLAGTVAILERAGFKIAHRVITYTPNMARELGLNPNSSKVYPDGARYVDTEKFRPEVPFNKRDNVVGFVGRLDEEKGIRELAELAKRLPQSIIFRFVGDGPLYDWLESELASEIRSGQVELTGWVAHENIPSELNNMKLLVMLSQPTEGLPTTILESMACGTPVYATSVGGVPDVVLEAETGMIIQSRNTDRIVKRITNSVESSDVSDYSNRSRELIDNKYSFSAAVERYREILTNLGEE